MWRTLIYFIVPNKLEDNVFIDVLSEVVGTGLRKLFSIITFDGLLRDVSLTMSTESNGILNHEILLIILVTSTCYKRSSKALRVLKYSPR